MEYGGESFSLILKRNALSVSLDGLAKGIQNRFIVNPPFPRTIPIHAELSSFL